MIPYQSNQSDFFIGTLPDKTFHMDFDSNTISGTISGIDAATQAAILILAAERYEHIIYSYRYGTEIVGLIGRSTEYACSELKRRITEALTQDDRINNVYDFNFSREKKAVNVSFTISTIFGEIDMERKVEL